MYGLVGLLLLVSVAAAPVMGDWQGRRLTDQFNYALEAGWRGPDSYDKRHVKFITRSGKVTMTRPAAFGNDRGSAFLNSNESGLFILKGVFTPMALGW